MTTHPDATNRAQDKIIKTELKLINDNSQGYLLSHYIILKR